MLWLRSCPRCTGDLTEEVDIYGAEVACLQCGYYLNASQERRLRRTHGQAALSRQWRMRKPGESRTKGVTRTRRIKRTVGG